MTEEKINELRLLDEYHSETLALARKKIVNGGSVDTAKKIILERALQLADNKEAHKMQYYNRAMYEYDKYECPPKLLPFGWESLDRIAQIPCPGITLIGALSHHGKSIFMRNIAMNLISNTAAKILYISYEEGCFRVMQHMAYLAYMGMHARGMPDFSPTDFNSWCQHTASKDESYTKGEMSAVDLLSERFFVFDKKYTPLYLSMVLREILEAHPQVRVVIIDYVQLIPSDERQSDQRYLEIKRIVDNLHTISKENRQAIIIAAQLAKDDHKTKSSQYDTSNARESKDIDNIADVSILVWNETANQMRSLGQDIDNNIAELSISVLKNRWHKRWLKRDIPFLLNKSTGIIQERV